MEGLPWPTITAAAGGWTLLGGAVLMLLTGRGLMSAREGKSYLSRAEKAEKNVEKLVTTLAETTTAAKLQQQVLVAIDAAVKGKSSPGDGSP